MLVSDIYSILASTVSLGCDACNGVIPAALCCKKHWSAHMVTADYLQLVTGIFASVAFLLGVTLAVMTCAELLSMWATPISQSQKRTYIVNKDIHSQCSMDIAGQCQVPSRYDAKGPMLQYTSSHMTFCAVCVLYGNRVSVTWSNGC